MDLSRIDSRSVATALRQLSIDSKPSPGEIGGRKVIILSANGIKVEAGLKGQKIKFSELTELVEIALKSKVLTLEQKSKMVRHFTDQTKKYEGQLKTFSFKKIFTYSNKVENLKNAEALLKNIGDPVVLAYNLMKLKEAEAKKAKETAKKQKTKQDPPKKASAEKAEETKKTSAPLPTSATENKAKILAAKNTFLKAAVANGFITQEQANNTQSLNDCRVLYKRLSLKLHPDKNGGNKEPFQLLNNSYERLEKQLEAVSPNITMTETSLSELDQKYGLKK